MWYSKYVFFIILAMLISLTGFVLVATRLDPCVLPGERAICQDISSLGLSLFFISLFFVLTSVFSLFGFLFRIWFHRQEVFLDHMNISLRQGFLLSIASLGSLALLLINSLTWWSGLLLVAIIVLIELYVSAGD